LLGIVGKDEDAGRRKANRIMRRKKEARESITFGVASGTMLTMPNMRRCISTSWIEIE